MSKPTFYITTPLYYVNAPPQLAVRTPRSLPTRLPLQAHDGFRCETSLHGYRRARPEDRTFREGAGNSNRRRSRIGLRSSTSSSGSQLGIEYDEFIRTTEPHHDRGGSRTVQARQGERVHLQGTSTRAGTASPTRLTRRRPIRRKPADCPDCGRTDRMVCGGELLLQALGVSGSAARATTKRIRTSFGRRRGATKSCRSSRVG